MPKAVPTLKNFTRRLWRSLMLIALSARKSTQHSISRKRDTLDPGGGWGAACLAKAVQYALKIIRKLYKAYGSKISLKKSLIKYILILVYLLPLSKNTLNDLSVPHTESQPTLSGVHTVMMEKLAQAGEGGGCTPIPFHYIYHHIQSCSVSSSWVGRYTHPISSLQIYVLCGPYLISRLFWHFYKSSAAEFTGTGMLALCQSLWYSDIHYF